ncbi:MAG: hypothetical protein SGILL_004790, partial [Bacillariaceae sp.]
AWILQIVLSEFLGVPTTIETGVEDAKLNFYDLQMPMSYNGVGYPWHALETSKNNSGDCTNTIQQSPYVPCAHAILEIWSGFEGTTEKLTQESIIEPRSFIGVVGEEAWWMPKYTAKEDPSLLSWFGLAGEENRQKLAEKFKRPTKWREYCEAVSSDNCARPDNVTSRAPLSMEEGNHYFLEGMYNGHFRYTDDNNCTLSENCTGHFLDYPCGWTSFFGQQAHHLNIALTGSGDQPGSAGYSNVEMVEVWHAANYTKSDIIGWRPEALYQQYQGTDFELQPVLMPSPSQECLDNRVDATQRCSLDPTERVGSELGVCAVPASPNYKAISTGLFELVHNNPNIPVPLQSPAYEVVKEFTMNTFQLGVIFDQWLSPSNGTLDKFGYDPRQAVCSWVQENLEDLQRQLIPRSYPRDIQIEETSMVSKVAIAFGFLAVTATLVTTAFTVKLRKNKSFVYAQIEFVFLLLFGLLQVSIAGVVSAFPPTDGLCIATSWLVNVGYTFELVPLVVKIAAIYSLSQAAARMKRIKLSRSFLFGVMGGILLIVLVYNILWTVLDPLKKEGDYKLIDSTTDKGSTIVTSPTDVNETAVVSFLIYWNFVCILVRLILILLGDSVDVTKTTAALSMIFSADTMVTLVIYFVPKIVRKDMNTSRRQTIVTMNFQQVWRPGESAPHGLDMSVNSRAGSARGGLSYLEQSIQEQSNRFQYLQSERSISTSIRIPNADGDNNNPVNNSIAEEATSGPPIDTRSASGSGVRFLDSSTATNPSSTSTSPPPSTGIPSQVEQPTTIGDGSNGKEKRSSSTSCSDDGREEDEEYGSKK